MVQLVRFMTAPVNVRVCGYYSKSIVKSFPRSVFQILENIHSYERVRLEITFCCEVFGIIFYAQLFKKF